MVVFLIFLPLINIKDIHLNMLQKLVSSPKCPQRVLSSEIGVYLDMVNYFMKKTNSRAAID